MKIFNYAIITDYSKEVEEEELKKSKRILSLRRWFELSQLNRYKSCTHGYKSIEKGYHRL